MSSTEIYYFNKVGECCGEYSVRNAFRGAMKVWHIMEEKYLPPFRPKYVPEGMTMEEFEQRFELKPSRLSITFNDQKENPAKEVWNLFENKSVPISERIVLGTTFDWVLVKREEIGKVIQAFRAFQGETNLGEQADILEECLKDENVAAIGWNQTSVNADTWMTAGRLKGNDEGHEPYNFLKQDKHWWLFDELGGGL